MPRLPARSLTTSLRHYSSSFRPQPAPPKLPAQQQAEFERLQRSAAVSAAFQPESESSQQGAAPDSAEKPDGDVSQGLFRGAKPEFEGDVNPKTGEVGGPKNEPLRWGGKGDWSYNGRVTDF
ncbi:hypothetical protein ACO1O0_007148 [Amphichorda felina]